MVDHDSESLASKLEKENKEAKSAALEAIAGLREAALRLEMSHTAAELREIGEGLDTDTFKILVMGRFKNGKSTFLNALLGNGGGEPGSVLARGPMVVDDMPATAILTRVEFAAEPWVKAVGFDDRSEEWTFERYMRESTQEIDIRQTNEKFRDIKLFEMGFPARLCEAGVVVYDSPGLDDHPDRTQITKEAARQCDVAIIVYKTDALMGQGERQDAVEAVAGGTRLFSVVNLWDGRTVDDRLRGFVWSRSIGLDGTPFTGAEDLADHDIYFVDALSAGESRYARDREGLRRSGMLEFEHRIFDFLARDRVHVHLSKFATRALHTGDAIGKHIEQRSAAATADKERLLVAHREIQPRLVAIRSRPARLAEILERFRADGTAALIQNFREAIAGIRRDLPDHMAQATLESSNGFLDVTRQKQLREEASEIASGFVRSRLDQWGENRAPAVLSPYVERMGAEIESEISEIEHELGRIHQYLTGWTMQTDGSSATVVSMKERVLSSVAGFFLGDISAAFTGGAGGWKGAVGGITGALVSSAALLALGVSASIVFLPVTLAAAALTGMAFGAHGFADRVKKAVIAVYDPEIAQLADTGSPVIAERVSSAFAAMQQAVTDQFSAIIAEEEQNITTMIEENMRGQEDRDRLLTELGALGRQVAAHRAVLDKAVIVPGGEHR